MDISLFLNQLLLKIMVKTFNRLSYIQIWNDLQKQAKTEGSSMYSQAAPPAPVYYGQPPPAYGAAAPAYGPAGYPPPQLAAYPPPGGYCPPQVPALPYGYQAALPTVYPPPVAYVAPPPPVRPTYYHSVSAPPEYGASAPPYPSTYPPAGYPPAGYPQYRH
jgi:hypothetical protein